jgi:hypothetical protein
VRRTVATLLVVACPVLIAAPVGAREGPESGPHSAGPVAIEAAPAPVPATVPTAPVAVAPPAQLTVTPAVPAPAVPAPAVAAVRPVVRAVRAKASAPAALVDDAAYSAQLRADLCQARAIFCGLDRGGRYPAG